jgi:hypothetical protein
MLRPQQGAETGQSVCIGEEEDVPPEAAEQTYTQGGCAFSTRMLALEGHDVTQDTHDVIQCLWTFWEAVVAVLACVAASGGLTFCSRRPTLP